jgi:hypothetical protein
MKCRYGLIVWTVLALFFSGCHFFEDSENVDECPLNSGYPCPCIPETANSNCLDNSGRHCCEDNQSRCLISADGDATRGICTLQCDGIEDTTCMNTKGFGSEGLCALKVNSSNPDYCAVVCNSRDDCPPGTGCLFVTSLNYSLCILE